MINKTLKAYIGICSLLIFTACNNDSDEGLSELVASNPEIEIEASNTVDFAQDFSQFETQQNWYLSDFDLDSESSRDEYVSESEIKFAISWTKRTRNHIADLLNVERSQMTHEYVNSFCEPKLEVGKERVYGNSNSDNIIAELDSDTKHCDIDGGNPAAISLKSFIPTTIGHKYRLSLRYKMRAYGAQSDRSYKNLIARFGKSLEKFEPVFDEFKIVEINTLALNKYSKLILKDNGLPDSYGILIDDISIKDLGKADSYDECADIFRLNSKGFKRCVEGEVDTDQVCEFTSIDNTKTNYKQGEGVVTERAIVSNAFIDEPAINRKLNFLSLGLKGKVSMSCTVGGHPGLFNIFEKTLSLREISWGNTTPDSYPELAKVRVKLQDCKNDILNRVNTVATVATNEELSLTFTENEDGISYEGCRMSKLIIKDITPDGPSKDGFDLNSVKFY